tara:strand:+ start:507 stop:1121 length:615 start_codon:yes stop_codon:yes gene_type:complete
MANGTLKVSNIETSSGSGTITIGQSGETVTIPSGCTVTNSGTASGFGGITMADVWRLTTSYQGDATITSNLERIDTPAGYGSIGSPMTESSGAFTFPSTGIYKVSFYVTFYITGNNPSRFNRATIRVTTDNSSYNAAAMGTDGIDYLQSSTSYAYAYAETIVDVTDTANVKVKFSTDVSDNNVYTTGNSDRSDTQMMFIRLGDT